MTLTTTQKSIDALLTGDRQYQIPDFQRPYVWEEPQAIALVNDLLGAWRTNDGDYFLGSAVLVQHPSGDDVDIIDGQQRMTTLCILLALLRHLAGVGSGLHSDTQAFTEVAVQSGTDHQGLGRAAAPARTRMRPRVLRHVHRRRQYRVSA